jgi:hypothetical protein
MIICDQDVEHIEYYYCCWGLDTTVMVLFRFKLWKAHNYPTLWKHTARLWAHTIIGYDSRLPFPIFRSIRVLFSTVRPVSIQSRLHDDAYKNSHPRVRMVHMIELSSLSRKEPGGCVQDAAGKCMSDLYPSRVPKTDGKFWCIPAWWTILCH